MATKRERIPVMSLYEWNLTLWAMSETRNRLDATGRGIYRELLDWCYAQGSIPDDHSAMARHCGASLEQFDAAWPAMKSHFTRSRKKENSLENKVANVQRKQYFAFIFKQRSNGKVSHKNRGKLNGLESGESIGLGKPLLQKSPNQEETRQEDKKREDKIEPSTNTPPAEDAEWIRQALLDFMAGRGGPQFSEAPDGGIVAQIWAAIDGFTTEDLREFLVALHASKKRPTKSWAWFVSVIQSGFDRRRADGAS